MGHLASGGGRSPGASLSVPVGGRAKALPWWRTPSVRRYLFGYTLLAPAVLYVGVLVGAPFLFSLYLALSDASVGAPVARFVGLENFTSALETGVFWTAVRNTLVFTVGAAVMKGFLGTTLAFLLVQPFKGRRVVRGLVVIPFTIPIAISVLGWKWMFDSQFSVLNWALSGLGLDGATEILPTLAYNTGIRGGALGRGAAISLFLFPLLLPAMIILLRTLRRRQY